MFLLQGDGPPLMVAKAISTRGSQLPPFYSAPLECGLPKVLLLRIFVLQHFRQQFTAISWSPRWCGGRVWGGRDCYCCVTQCLAFGGTVALGCVLHGCFSGGISFTFCPLSLPSPGCSVPNHFRWLGYFPLSWTRSPQVTEVGRVPRRRLWQSYFPLES